ncbi:MULTISPECIES: hypothetical protein [unclassified Pedobacter]|uniref:hypothetical protein n=1 Tax=unclassified Pedobacter TaxID=2628915 RepID=UPI001E468BA2|nr:MULTISPECIES: hypothetical protein [unclassified Pedobacter]
MYYITSHRLLSIAIQRIFLSVIFCSFIYATKAQPLPFFGETSNGNSISLRRILDWGKENKFKFDKVFENYGSEFDFQRFHPNYPSFQLIASNSSLVYTRTNTAKINCFEDFFTLVLDDSVFLLMIPVAITAFYFLRKKV